MHGYSHLSTKTLMEIKNEKCILLEDKASDWLQIRTSVSSLNVKGKKAILLLTGPGQLLHQLHNAASHILQLQS